MILFYNKYAQSFFVKDLLESEIFMRYQFLRFPEGKTKAVTLSYDDGCEFDVKFSDIITSYGLKCTFNLNCDALRGDKHLSKETVKEKILARGHEVAVHGSFHRAEGKIRPIEGIREVLDCRLELEKKYGMIIRGMAYPDSGITAFCNGATYEKVKNYLTELDIAYARTLNGDNNSFSLPEDWHRWTPTARHLNPHVLSYIEEFNSIKVDERGFAGKQPLLFYLWGHSYEFDRDNNWDLLEKICEGLSGKDDVWYATNIEIYNYVNAYNSLIYSADSSIIYNPTLYTIWFNIDGKPYSIKSGETLYL